MMKYNELISLCCLLLMTCSFSFARAEKIAKSSSEESIEISETSSGVNQESESPSEESEKLTSSSLSEGEESVEGQNGIFNPKVQASMFTGSASSNIPILVPPGRAGIAPNLSFQYNSSQKNGLIGVGWNIDIGSIQRSIKFGVDYSANDFVAFKSGSSAELVSRGDLGAQYYRAKIEGTTFFKYYFKRIGIPIFYSINP